VSFITLIMMHKKYVGLLVSLVIILLGMIGHQELKTAPVDPRDIFRGEYVILGYELSAQAEAFITDDLKDSKNIYVSLDTSISPAIVSSVSLKKPKSGVYIKGDLNRRWSNNVNITFPSLAQYYVPEGQGKVIEDLEPGALEVEVSVKNGQARIIDLLFEPQS